MGVKEQLTLKHTPHHQRFALMDEVLLPSLLWGLEPVALVKAQRRGLDAFQRTVVGRMLQVASAERCITAALKRCATGHWGNIQKYRYFGFRGHVEPSSAEHDVARVTRWRNSEWWHEHKARLPAKTGGQHRRRPQDLSNPCHDKAPMRKALKHAQGKVWWAALEEALREAGLRIATPLRRYVALGGRSEDGLHSGRRCKEAW